MNSEYTRQHQKPDLDEIEIGLKQLSEREYERDTFVLVAFLKQSLERIWESISKNSQYGENFARFQRLKNDLATLELKLRKAQEAQRLEIEALRDAGLPL